MNHKRFFLFTALLTCIMEFIPAAIILMELTYFTTEEMDSLKFIFFLLPIPVFCYLANCFIKKIWAFLPVTFITFFVYAVFLGRIGKVQLVLSLFYFTYIMVQTFVNVREEHPTTRRNASLFLLVIPAVALIFNMVKEYSELNRCISVMMAIGIFLYLLNHYLLNFNSFFSVYHEMKGVPYRQMRSSNHLMICLFFVVCAGGMGLALLIPFRTIFPIIGNLLYRALRFVLQLIFGRKEEEKELIVEEEPEMEPVVAGQFQDDEETALWLQILGQVLYWLAIVALIAGAVILLGYGLYRLYRYFYQRNLDIRDTVERVQSQDKRERLSKTDFNIQGMNKKAKKPGRFFAGNGDKIRRIFILTVQKLVPDEVPVSLTPEELLIYRAEQHGLIKEIQKERPREYVEELVRLYHKARYSEQSCTGEDVKKAKRCYHALCEE